MTSDVKRALARAWRGNRALVVIFLFALAVRVAYSFAGPQIDPFLRADPLHGDARDYDELAWNLAQGLGFTENPPQPTSFRAPLYPYFLSVVYMLFGHSLVAARLSHALLGALGCVLTLLISDRLAGRRVAILTGIGMALHPLLIYFEPWIITDTLFIFLLVLGVLLALYARDKPAVGRVLGLGIVLGLATLTRPQVALMLPLLALWFFFSAEGTRKCRITRTLLILVFTALPILPWTIRNYLVYGEFVFISTQGGYTFYGAHNPDAFGGHVAGFPPALPGLAEPEADREYYRLGLQWIRENPQAFVALLPRKFVRLWSPVQVNTSEGEYPLPFAGGIRLLYTLYLAVALLGGLRLGWRRAVILYLPIICFSLAGLMYYGGTRYALPMAPFLVVLAAVGCSALLGLDRPNRAGLQSHARDSGR